MAQPNTGYLVVTGVPSSQHAKATTAVGGSAAELAAEQSLLYKGVFFQYRPVTIGILRAELELQLGRNALITSWPVVLTARVADSTPATSIAQLRSYYTDTAARGLVTVIVDLGAPRTVSALSSPPTQLGIFSSDFAVQRVLSWTGAAFDESNPAYFTSFIASHVPVDHQYTLADINPAAPSTYATTILSEVRTSKLQVDMITSLAPEEAAAKLHMTLPDLPAQLALSIDGGPPIWTHVDVVAPRAPGDTDVTFTDWSGEGKRLVDIADALNALASDPLAPIDAASFTLTLTSEVPGVLNLEEGSSVASEHVPYVRHLHRMDLGAGGQRHLEFAEESEQPITLALPTWGKTLERIALELTADVEERRVLPAVGPARADVAMLVLDSAHAVTAQLAVTLDEPLVELTAVRVPLLAGAEGAEARVVLLTPGEEPGAPLDGAVSAPVEFAANAGGAEVWHEFTFEAPVALEAGKPAPWAALIVSRGRLEWTLGLSERALRRGPPSGPWVRMPGVIESRSELGARIRTVGRAEAEAPVAPLQLQLRAGAPDTGVDAAASPWVPVTPTADGVTAALADLALDIDSQGQLQLWVRSRTPTTVTIENLDLTLEANGEQP